MRDETKLIYIETIELARTLEKQSQKLHKQLGSLTYTNDRVVGMQNQLYKAQLTQATLSITLAEMLSAHIVAHS